MRVLLVSGALGKAPRGNRSTIERWIAAARAMPDVELLAAVPEEAERHAASVDLVHGYHALHGGLEARRLAAKYGLPLVVSLGGTDLGLFRRREGRYAEVAEVLAASTVVTGAFPAFGAGLPGGARYLTVPRALSLPPPGVPRCPSGRLRVLLPAGLRPVKDVVAALDLAEMLAENGLLESFELLGTVHDADYAKPCLARLRTLDARPGLRAGHDVVGPEAMAAAHARADVVWNTSLEEGGANALLEALAAGAGVWARDVPGNHEMFAGADLPHATLGRVEVFSEVLAFHERLATADLEAWTEHRDRSRAWLAAHHAPEIEARALHEAWTRAAAEPSAKRQGPDR